jgi:hypothetical protein
MAGATGTEFWLRLTGGQAELGPFRFANGEKIRFAGEEFELLLGKDAKSKRFGLKSLRTGKMYGPFDYKAQAELRLGGIHFEVAY